MDHCYFKYLFYRYLNCRDRSCSIQTFDWSHVKKNYAERNTRNADTRKLLASYILLSLEVLVVADIIESVIADLDRYFEACTYYYHSNSHFLFLESGNRRQRKQRRGEVG